MSTAGKAKRLAAAVIPERPLQALRALWYRARALDPRRLFHQRRFRQLNRGAAADEIVLRPGLRLAVDRQAREPFEWFCFRAPEMVAELDAFLARSSDRCCFLDVGACYGLFSLAFTHGRPGAQAVAVEPSPLAWEVLESNLRRNSGARVTPLQVAVGAAPGTLTMRYSWHHLEALPEAAGDPTAIEIPLRTLDLLCAELGFRPDVVKIDVEGYELAALRGARRILEENQPLLFLEIHPARIVELGGSIRELSDLLSAFGYRIFDLDGTPVTPARLAAMDAVSRFLCQPVSLPGERDETAHLAVRSSS
jgi:FkbM family methyltransferase